MQLSIPKQYLLKPLQTACSIVDRKTTAPILSNALISCHNNYLSFLATDMEIQICHRIVVENLSEFSITVAARKMLDIIKVLGEADIIWKLSENKIKIQQEKSLFELHTLPSKDFPLMQSNIDIKDNIELNITQKQLKHQLHSVSFAMAVQDVRYYLNGMLFKVENNQLILVATDGHRMACSKSPIQASNSIETILPRKTVLELLRLLDDSDNNVNIQINTQQVTFSFGDIELISKLIDGKFPDYNRLIPQNHPFLLTLKRADLHLGLQRVSILTNDKLRAAKFILNQNGLSLFASNSDNEEVKEDITASYNGNGFEVGFNIAYWIDVVNVLKQEDLTIALNNSNSSALLIANDDIHEYRYIVMPMRI